MPTSELGEFYSTSEVSHDQLLQTAKSELGKRKAALEAAILSNDSKKIEEAKRQVGFAQRHYNRLQNKS